MVLRQKIAGGKCILELPHPTLQALRLTIEIAKQLPPCRHDARSHAVFWNLSNEVGCHVSFCMEHTHSEMPPAIVRATYHRLLRHSARLSGSKMSAVHCAGSPWRSTRSPLSEQHAQYRDNQPRWVRHRTAVLAPPASPKHALAAHA